MFSREHIGQSSDRNGHLLGSSGPGAVLRVWFSMS